MSHGAATHHPLAFGPKANEGFGVLDQQAWHVWQRNEDRRTWSVVRITCEENEFGLRVFPTLEAKFALFESGDQWQ